MKLDNHTRTDTADDYDALERDLFPAGEPLGPLAVAQDDDGGDHTADVDPEI